MPILAFKLGLFVENISTNILNLIFSNCQLTRWQKFSWAWAYRAWGRGGGGASLLGKQSQSGNIRSTVGQYWLIIKKNVTNSVNFVGNCVNFVGNCVISGKFV